MDAMAKSGTGTPMAVWVSQIKPSTSGKHRRRLLKSRTVDTFLHILSHCYENSSQEPPTSGNGDTGTGTNTKYDGFLASTDAIPSNLSCQEETTVDESSAVLGTREDGLYSKHLELTECGHGISEGREELPLRVDKHGVCCLEIKNQGSKGLTLSTLRIGDCQSVPEFDIEEFHGQIFNHEVLDALESSLDVEKKGGVSNSSRDTNDKNPQMGRSSSEDVMYEAQHTRMELEKPVCTTDLMNSSCDVTVEKDVEEGEIMGELTDFLLEDDRSSLDKTKSKVLFPEDFIGDEPQTGLEDHTNLIPLSTNTIDNVSKDMEAVSRTKRNLVDYSEVVVRAKTFKDAMRDRYPARLQTSQPAKQGSAGEKSDCATVCPETLPQLRGILNSSETIDHLVSPNKDSGAQNSKKKRGFSSEDKVSNKKVKMSVNQTASLESIAKLGEHSGDTSQDVVDASSIKVDAGEIKKKRVLTKERKAKKKQKERIKRAEKNRKLGVKRLKLQPVIKEKKVTYCRHYMNGRCHEGEKCKFSHDTIPLTKSKPCCHFARHTCMKGDDCPFDHQLSKYPCNNYLSKGFCSRGADCMFSHEAQATEASLIVSSESRPEPKSLSHKDNSGSKMQINIDSPSEKVDRKSSSIQTSASKDTEPNLSVGTPRLSPQPPKGITFLSKRKLSLEASSSPEVKATLSPKVDAGVKNGCQTIHNASEAVLNSNGTTKTTPVIPRGINFLSFGKKPMLDNSSRSFSFKMGSGIGKSPLSNSIGKGAKSDSSVSGDDGVNGYSQTSQNMPDSSNDKKHVNCELFMNGQSTITPSSSQKLMLPSISSSLQRTLQSTLTFASKFESGIKTCSSVDSPGSFNP